MHMTNNRDGIITWTYTPDWTCSPMCFKPIKIGNSKLPERYIINEGAAVLFWNDDTKTISKRHKEDTFDKELGFLFAYYYKKCGLTNAARKRVIDSIDYSKIKTFLFEMFVKESGYTVDKARSYLKGLKVSK